MPTRSLPVGASSERTEGAMSLAMRETVARTPACRGEARIGTSAVVDPPGVHSDAMPAKARSSFHTLTPDRVLDAVEAGGLRCTGRCLPLRAFENRVYEVELEDERRLVVKFYRPGRWSRETILDEHRFLQDLAEAELPVVAPLDLGTGQTLNEAHGILYAAFPKVRGR